MVTLINYTSTDEKWEKFISLEPDEYEFIEQMRQGFDIERIWLHMLNNGMCSENAENIYLGKTDNQENIEKIIYSRLGEIPDDWFLQSLFKDHLGYDLENLFESEKKEMEKYMTALLKLYTNMYNVLWFVFEYSNKKKEAIKILYQNFPSDEAILNMLYSYIDDLEAN